MKSIVHESSSVEQTEQIAADLAARMQPGDCIALDGDLGAGKTQFVRGLVRGLGGNTKTVSSPTYVLLNIYDTGRLPVFHLDAYRVRGSADFEGIGFSELLEQGGVVAVEWPSRILELLPTNCVQVKMHVIDVDRRRIEIVTIG